MRTNFDSGDVIAICLVVGSFILATVSIICETLTELKPQQSMVAPVPTSVPVEKPADGDNGNSH